MSKVLKMHASSNSKSSSSDDDLLLDSELSSATRKKHFLDYDYDHQSPPTTNLTKISEAHGSKMISKSGNSISMNNNNNAAVDSKKKIIERPSTSKTATIDQMNSKAANVDSVYSILSMLGSINSADVTAKFLEFSKNREMCAQLRLSGCISLLVQIIHSDQCDEIRHKECLQTLHNIIHCHPDDKAGRREARVLKLIEQLFDYCDSLRAILNNELSDSIDRYPIQAIGTLMKISFDEEHRYAMCQLGAIQTISTLIQLDHAVHGPLSVDSNCVTMRRYAGMCLTNLTFGDGNNKALLCSNKNFMRALVDQINSNSDELVPVTASVIRNLSWRADTNMKEVLNEIGTVKTLTVVAIKCTQENTLKAILSALWNLSNHCAKNKAEFCEINGAIEFLIDMLSYEAPSKTTSVIENAGGILRNLSTHIALHEELRVILRRKNCYGILLQQLKSPSLTVVSNACGTLGNLSAHCVDDQKFLRDNGAIPMLRSLIFSKHKMISTGSTIALRHLTACKSNVSHNGNLDSVAKMMDLKELPTLNVRKQKALEHELNMSRHVDDTSPSSKDDKTKDFNGTSKEKSSKHKVQDIEDDDEDSPTNFSKFDDDQDEPEQETYQETNLDQITDYSIRYAENQSDSDDEVKKPTTNNDDTVKCYNTEGTPHAVLSSAGSLTDLRKEKLKKSVEEAKVSSHVSGTQSPEKTVNYCVEGTPANFSRCDSLSDLEEGLEAKAEKVEVKKTPVKVPPPPLTIRKEFHGEKESVAATPKSVTFVNTADETPLMFSRTSSIGSLDSADPVFADDKSSVVSDFSRLASGIISPSEFPDSPTQSIPQSPSRLQTRGYQKHATTSRTPPLPVTRENLGGEAAEDATNTFQIENTPATFSYATSLSNLSFDDEPKISTDAISKDFQLMKHPSVDEDDQRVRRSPINENTGNDVTQEQHDQQPPDTADHSDVESADDNILLESCINIGMNRVTKASGSGVNNLENDSNASGINKNLTTKVVKENPIDMMRGGAPLLPPYLPVHDEVNKFTVEDTPCNLSVMSGLSAITMESNMNAIQTQNIKKFIQRPTAKIEPTIRSDEAAGTSKKSPAMLAPQKVDFEDSLSSLSIESEDDGNLLSQTIAAGLNKPAKQDTSTSHPINIPTKPRASAELCNESISSVDSCGKEDANVILEQCIQSGINKVVKKETTKSKLVTSSPKKSMLPKPGTSKLPKPDKKILEKKDEELLQECIATGILKNTRQDKSNLVQNFTQLSISDPKNAQSTSVIAMDNHHHQCVSTITGVEVKVAENNTTMINSNECNFSNHGQDENIASKSELSPQENWMMQNGFDLNLSLGSMDENILERSNEYPAAKPTMSAYGDFDDDSIMEVSNEFMMENEKMAEAKIEDKHKDPDLMMKSVDRLTQELVSTAEFLRKNACSDDSGEQKMSNSISNNTWNDENSFPSISISAPMIASTNDEITIATDQIYPMPEEKVEPQIFDDKTPTNEVYKFDVTDAPPAPQQQQPKIDFKVGGEIGTSQTVSKLNFMSFGPMSIETCSTMSNSTIVQVEAKRIANKLTSLTNRLMDSTTSLDLENVQPPSSMDCISLNSYQDISIQQSPLKQSKKQLMSGLVARRALSGQQMFSGSAESVNIENIRPPSIMDDLLDSMISVDSIVSEIVDPTTLGGISNYETAISDMEDSLTLRSCQDLSKDDGTSSDFSSVESTPKKKRNSRAMTPKQKRQSDKDRYKTYTIQVDMLLKEQHETSSTESMRRSLNARQRRQEDRQRFETQVINLSSSSPSRSPRRKENPERFKTYNIESDGIDDDPSIREMTANFEFLRNSASSKGNSSNIETVNNIRDKLNQIRSGSGIKLSSVDSLEYEPQTSETESQRDLKNSLSDQNSSVEQEQVEVSVKTKSTKNSYISPYRMTTRLTPTKNKAVKIIKTPTIAKIVTRNQNGLDLKTQSATKNRVKSAPSLKTSNIPKSNTPVMKAKEPEPPAMPIRQGTFIQDEPTLENVPVVTDLSTSPSKASVSKLKPPSRVPSASKIPTTPTGDQKKMSPKKGASNLPTSVSNLKFRSNSNASMKTPVVTPVRSNTGINLSNPRKNVTSKIAGIWKNTEKKEISIKKPISTTSIQSKLSSTPSTRKTNEAAKGTERIKRSSTCEEIV
ncbi:CLUMA_CG015828, isoform A [Clunio marinus]|uniref:CLUMA_CG015828, isoform A n=1 Tax=Clunio marinus TaxID=568069 RepID=A0A1J1IWF8_9DIPT|nr:CLUMA_CG015828, isoform A [Clunio marinus]